MKDYPPAWDKNFPSFLAHIKYWRKSSKSTEELIKNRKLYIDTYVYVFANKISSEKPVGYAEVKAAIFESFLKIKNVKFAIYILACLTKVLNEELEEKWNKRFGNCRAFAVRFTIFIIYIMKNRALGFILIEHIEEIIANLKSSKELSGYNFHKLQVIFQRLWWVSYVEENQSEVSAVYFALFFEIENLLGNTQTVTSPKMIYH